MASPHIRIVALCVFRQGHCVLVSDGVADAPGGAFCRPLGGAVEYGERAADAVVREIEEELGVAVCEVRLLGVLENLFIYNGQRGHEIVFVYDARFVDESLYARATLPFHEAGWATESARWLDLRTAGHDGVRLVPEGLAELLTQESGAAPPTSVVATKQAKAGR